MTEQHQKPPAPHARDGESYVPGELSLAEEVEALIADGRTLLEAELAFQKSRAAFVSRQARAAALFGSIAALCCVLAAIGLTVGLIIALTPALTAWGATALVVGLITLAAVLCALAAVRRWRKLTHAMRPDEGRRP